MAHAYSIDPLRAAVILSSKVPNSQGKIKHWPCPCGCGETFLYVRTLDGLYLSKTMSPTPQIQIICLKNGLELLEFIDRMINVHGANRKHAETFKEVLALEMGVN